MIHILFLSFLSFFVKNVFSSSIQPKVSDLVPVFQQHLLTEHTCKNQTSIAICGEGTQWSNGKCSIENNKETHWDDNCEKHACFENKFLNKECAHQCGVDAGPTTRSFMYPELPSKMFHFNVKGINDVLNVNVNKSFYQWENSLKNELFVKNCKDLKMNIPFFYNGTKLLNQYHDLEFKIETNGFNTVDQHFKKNVVRTGEGTRVHFPAGMSKFSIPIDKKWFLKSMTFMNLKLIPHQWDGYHWENNSFYLFTDSENYLIHSLECKPLLDCVCPYNKVPAQSIEQRCHLAACSQNQEEIPEMCLEQCGSFKKSQMMENYDSYHSTTDLIQETHYNISSILLNSFLDYRGEPYYKNGRCSQFKLNIPFYFTGNDGTYGLSYSLYSNRGNVVNKILQFNWYNDWQQKILTLAGDITVTKDEPIEWMYLKFNTHTTFSFPTNLTFMRDQNSNLVMQLICSTPTLDCTCPS